VGSYVVQLAALLGGRVTATGRERQRDFVLGLGAEALVASGAAAPADFDVVVDTVGGAVLDASYALTRRGGRLVTLSAPPSKELAAAQGLHATFFVVSPDTAALTRLAGLVDEGSLRTLVSQTFPLAEGAAGVRECRPPASAGQDRASGPLTAAGGVRCGRSCPRSRCARSAGSSGGRPRRPSTWLRGAAGGGLIRR
jgi:hypothetical protein